MCGIAGIFNVAEGPEPSAELLGAMAADLAHRGPDDQGIEVGPWWGLASRRLAIIGIETGHQPLSNEDGTVWVAFNGEIYNHWDIREDLAGRGHIFSSASDTEVLVHLYEDYGDDLLDHVQGMFAFAIVDTTRGRVLLARDRLGQKPLYYALTDAGRCVFASEFRALLRHPGISRRLDFQALGDYLSLGSIPSPGSIFSGVKKLPPACSLAFEWRCAEGRLRRYWRAEFEPKQKIPFVEAALEVRQRLETAVAQRLEAEVPLGAFLSGGVDSTIIVGIMQGLLEGNVQTFTIGFDDPRYDERRYADLAAAALGTQHRTKVAEPRDLELLRHLIRHHGEPFADSSMLPTALLSGFTREHVTVALSGDGGDEIFGGYRRYQAMFLYRSLAFLPQSLRTALGRALLALLPRARRPKTALGEIRRLLQALSAPPLAAYGSFQQIFSPAARAALLTAGAERIAAATAWWEELLDTAGTARDFVERFLELDLLTYLPDDLLCKVDIASMMHSLEVRSPFLDHRLVEYVAALPRQYKVGFGGRKRLLLAAAGELLPPAIQARGKRGFGLPISAWLRTDLADQVREMVFWHKDWDPDGIFDPGEVRRLAEEHVAGFADHGYRLWALLCYRLWTEEILHA